MNFGSGAAVVGQPTQAAYASAKEAIRGLSRVVANEWASQNIRVNVVCPMAMTAGVKAWSESAPELYRASLSKVPLGRFGDPETDVAPIVAFQRCKHCSRTRPLSRSRCRWPVGLVLS